MILFNFSHLYIEACQGYGGQNVHLDQTDHNDQDRWIGGAEKGQLSNWTKSTKRDRGGGTEAGGVKLDQICQIDQERYRREWRGIKMSSSGQGQSYLSVGCQTESRILEELALNETSC